MKPLSPTPLVTLSPYPLVILRGVRLSLFKREIERDLESQRTKQSLSPPTPLSLREASRRSNLSPLPTEPNYKIGIEGEADTDYTLRQIVVSCYSR